MKRVFLHPGEYFVGNACYQVRTVLGSCVSVTLWHARLRIGAMSHFLLPTRMNSNLRNALPNSNEKPVLDAKYADEVILLILEDLWRCGVAPRECAAKLFGGGDMFPERAINDAFDIGRRNGEAARRLLLSQGIEIIAESLFGVGHRQVSFELDSGTVWSRQIAPYGHERNGPVNDETRRQAKGPSYLTLLSTSDRCSA